MFAQMSDREWLRIAGECYLVGFLLGTWSLFRGGRPSTALVYGLIAAGYILQLLGLYLRGLSVGGCLMTGSLAVGTIYWVDAPDTVNLAKLMVTIGVWAAYVITFALRAKEQLVSRRFAWVCIAVFALALLSLGPVDSSRHARESEIALCRQLLTQRGDTLWARLAL